MRGPRKYTVLDYLVLLKHQHTHRSSGGEAAGRGGMIGEKNRRLGKYESLVLHASVKILFYRTWEPLNNLQYRNVMGGFTCYLAKSNMGDSIPSVLEGFDFFKKLSKISKCSQNQNL